MESQKSGNCKGVSKMDYKQYYNLLKLDPNEAKNYKNGFIPDVLYKYYALDDNQSLNEKKIKTLSDGKLYMSCVEDFNDPFEGNAFTFDYELLKEYGWDKTLIDSFVCGLKNTVGICCLSDGIEGQHNLPMWAYYANNHKGFCVEYVFSTEQKGFIYPVSYEKDRVSGNCIVPSILLGMFDVIMNKTEEVDFVKKMLMILSLTVKHISWQHEREYRVLTVRQSEQDFFPALPNRIFIGKDCDIAYCEKLIEIGKRYKCDVYKMTCNSEVRDFKLVEQKVL